MMLDQAILDLFVERGAILIDDQLGSAQAHAEKALSDTLRKASDGRATRLKVARSLSYQAAIKRLDDLRDGLVKIVREAREELYLASFEALAPQIPEAYRISVEPYPVRRNVDRFVGALIHGQAVDHEIQQVVERAKQRLLATITLGEGARPTVDRIDGWRILAGNGMLSWLKTSLSDSQVAADREAARDLLHPGLIDDSPVETV